MVKTAVGSGAVRFKVCVRCVVVHVQYADCNAVLKWLLAAVITYDNMSVAGLERVMVLVPSTPCHKFRIEVCCWCFVCLLEWEYCWMWGLGGWVVAIRLCCVAAIGPLI
jgi:hypothetical protein